MTFSHRELCEIGAKWCKRPASQFGHGCQIAIVEGCADHENADVIGFRHSNPCKGSVLIEVKVSRSDFLADKKKPHRVKPETGMGKWRYFLCPENIIKPEDLKNFPKWGLLYGYPNGRIKVIVGPLAGKPNWKERSERLNEYAFDEYNLANEQVLLIKSLTRFEELDDMIKLQRANNRVANQSMRLSEQNNKLSSENNLLKSNVKRKLDDLLNLKCMLKDHGIDYLAKMDLTFTTLFDVHELETQKKRLIEPFFSAPKENLDQLIAVIDAELEVMNEIQVENLREACRMRYRLDLSLILSSFIKEQIRSTMSKETLLKAISDNAVEAGSIFDDLLSHKIIQATGAEVRFTESFQQFSFSYIYDDKFFRMMNK